MEAVQTRCILIKEERGLTGHDEALIKDKERTEEKLT